MKETQGRVVRRLGELAQDLLTVVASERDCTQERNCSESLSTCGTLARDDESCRGRNEIETGSVHLRSPDCHDHSWELEK